MEIEIEENPNCPESPLMVFSELGDPRPIRGLLTGNPGAEGESDVVAVKSDGTFSQAYAVKVADSGDGSAFLIYGAEWGIRLKPESRSGEPWDLKNPHQWGEPYKVYGRSEDILFKSPGAEHP